MHFKFNSIPGTKPVHFLDSLTSDFLDRSEDGALGLMHENVGAWNKKLFNSLVFCCYFQG